MNDAELKVLGAILPDSAVRMERAQLRLIGAQNFKTPALQELWKFVDMYYDSQQAVMPEWWLKEKALQSGYAPAQVSALVQLYRGLAVHEVSESEFKAALEILKEDEQTYRTQQAIVTAREIVQGEYIDDNGEQSLSGQADARAYLTETLAELEVEGSEAAPEGDMREDMEKLWRTYISKEENPDVMGGIKYGIKEIDDYTGGVRPGELVLIAGFTGSSKSSLCASLAWNALRSGKNVVMFTTETTREEMEVRILARHSRLLQFKTPGGLDSHDILSGTLSPQHKKVFREVLDDFKEGAGSLFMVQMPANGNADYVHVKANQYNRKAPIDLIIIDSINLLRASRRYDSKREMLEDLLQDFKRFASSFDNGRGAAIVSPWQMSRTAWKEAMEAGGVYTLASLSDTSEAEKSQPLSAKVLTPTGYKRMGDIQEGDYVVSASTGGKTGVKKVHPNGVRPIYEITTNDMLSTEASPNHLWTVYANDKVQTLKTTEVKELVDNEVDVYLPLLDKPFAGGTPFEDIIIPEFMAALLKEHHPQPNSLTLTTDNFDQVSLAFSCFPRYALDYGNSPKMSLVYTAEDLAHDPYLELLIEANLFSGKQEAFRIPEVYLSAPSVLREDLIRHMSDHPENMDAPLEEVVKELPYWHKGYGKMLLELVLSMGITPDGEPRRIIAVEDTGRQEEVRCITINKPDGLYVTDGMIVTHNSASQIITVFKGDNIGEPGRINMQVLKNRSGKEMGKISYPIDYRNSWIGSSEDESAPGQMGNDREEVVRNLGSLMGD